MTPRRPWTIISAHPDAARLFAQDEALRREAGEMLERSGIGAIMQAYGYVPVGSYAMRTMTWRDLDAEAYAPEDWETHWAVGQALARTGWCYRANCVDMSREEDCPGWGLYWGLRVADPAQPGPCAEGSPGVWKLDLWRAPAEAFKSRAGEQRRLWQSLLTDEARSYVLALKEAVCRDPRYRRSLLSVHVYEAVLQHGVTSVDALWEWWRRTHAPSDQ